MEHHHDHMGHAMMNSSGGSSSGHFGMSHGGPGDSMSMGHPDHADSNHHMDGSGPIGHGGHGAGDPAMCNSHGGAGHHMMSMAFHGGYCETILFDQWKTTSLGGLIGSVIGIVIMAALYEGLKYYREYLFWKTYNALQYRSVTVPQEKNVVNTENRVVHMVGEVIHKQPPTMFSLMHAFQTLLHIVQIILSYFLMLIFMTYNVWLCFAVVLGAAIGYFLFGWKKSVIVDVTEHCH